MHGMRQKPDHTHLIRNLLFREGQKCESKARMAFNQTKKNPSHENITLLIHAIGVLEGYLQSRTTVAPYIPTDVALQSQQGLVKQVSRWLESMKI